MLEIVGAHGDATFADLEYAEELQGVGVGIEVGVDWIPPPVSQSLRREVVQFPRNCARGAK